MAVKEHKWVGKKRKKDKTNLECLSFWGKGEIETLISYIKYKLKYMLKCEDNKNERSKYIFQKVKNMTLIDIQKGHMSKIYKWFICKHLKNVRIKLLG